MAELKLDTILLIIAIIVLIVFMGKLSDFQFSTNVTITQDVKDKLDNPPAQPECRLWFDVTTAEIGDAVTGTIQDGKLTSCDIYYKFNDGAWTYDSTVTTDFAGFYEETRTPAESVGTFTFAAICGDCVTNYQDLEIIPSPDAPEEPECYNDDGGNNVWVQGDCHAEDGTITVEICPMGNFERWLTEAWCDADGNCAQGDFDCTTLDAMCYEGRCVRWADDTDGDGWPDLDEYEQGTDPNDPNSYPGAGQDGETTCSQYCTTLFPESYAYGQCGILGIMGSCPMVDRHNGDNIQHFPADLFCSKNFGVEYNCCCYPTRFPN